VLQLLAPLLLFVGTLVVLLRPSYLFPILLVVAATINLKVRIGGIAIYPSNVLILATAAGMLFLGIRRRSLRLLRIHLISLLNMVWILFLALLLPGVGGLKRILALSIFYLAFESGIQGVRSRSSALNLRSWVIISGVLASIVAIITRSTSAFNHRAVGAFGNPNSLGMFLAGCLPLTFSQLLAARSGSKKRLVVLIATLIIFYGLWISGSRGALIGSLTGCLFLSLHEFRRAILGATILGMVLFLTNYVEESHHGLARMPHAFQVISVVFENSKVWLGLNGNLNTDFTAPPWIKPGVLQDFPQTFGARLMIWYQATLTGLHHPITGIGPGNSSFSAVPFDSKTFNNSFNIYLASFTEAGVVGLFLHLLWLKLIFSHALSILKESDSSRVGQGLVSSSLTFCIHGLLEDTYFGILSNWMIGLLFGSLVGYSVTMRETVVKPTRKSVDTQINPAREVTHVQPSHREPDAHR
jgi:O-antigen ligase